MPSREFEDILKHTTNAGVYAISPKKRKGKYIYLGRSIEIKVGQSINLRDRFDSYHTCFNDWFELYAVMLVKKGAFIGSKAKSEKTKFLLKVEKAIMLRLKKFQMPSEVRRNPEWFKCSPNLVKQVFQEVYELKKFNKFLKKPQINFD